MKVIGAKVIDQVKYWKLGYSLWGYPKIFVHMFLVDGLLIDTGMTNLRKEIKSLVENEHITKMVITHYHEDHSGNIEVIKKTKSIEAYASPKCVELMEDPPLIQPVRRMTWGQHKKAHLLPLPMQKLLETEHYSFNIIRAPGHAIDQICLFEKSKGWLFSADVFVHDRINIFMRDEEIGQQIRTIKKLLKLDFKFLFCSHQPILKNAKGRLENKLNFLEEYFAKVSQEYNKGKDANEVLQSLNLKEYHVAKLLSLGELSQINMIRSVIRSIENPII